MIKRFYILLLAIVASVGMSWATTTDLASITDNYTAQDGEILTGTLGVNVKISIADGATVTLLNANINGDKTWTTGEYAGLTCLGDATITIVGKNSVSGFYADDLGNGFPGIYVPSGKTLIINGTGSLTAQSSTEEAAGIGARKDTHCGNIEIQSGKITAIACGEYGAGIGGAYNANCGNITISGGIVTAVGGDHCAGIGGGRRGASTNAGHCGNILISGGVVSATSGEQAAAIGGGRGNNNNYKTNCGTITITNTALKVYADQGGSSTNTIGAAKYGNCGAVTIGDNTGVINNDPYTYRTKEDGEIVVDYINAIGTVVYTQECKDKIDIARELYDALEDSQKTLVTNYQVLLDAEAAYAALIPQPGSAATVWTSLAVGDVIKVGDQLSPSVEWESANDYGVIKPAWAPYTLLRANITQEHAWDDPVVTEAEDGAYYVFKFTHPTSGTSYLLANSGKSPLLAATATSDGLEVTNVGDDYGTPAFTFAVHDGGGSSAPAWVKAGDVWDEDTKTLTVNSNPGTEAYYQNTEIKHLIISDGVTTIGESAFDECTALLSVVIGNDVTNIEAYAFDECGAMTSLTIGNKVQTIGESAFGSCESLTSVIIPNSVTSIGNSAFNTCDKISSLTIGSSVQTIGESAFKNCSMLTDVTIPASVENIGAWFFRNCENLATITCKATTPPTLGNNAFFDCDKLTHIYVPAASVATYKAADNWATKEAIISAPPANSITINGTPQVGDNSISLTYYFDPGNVSGICCYAPTLKVKCVTDNNWDEKWLILEDISSGTETITLNTLGSFQAGKEYAICYAYHTESWVDEVFQSFSFPAVPANSCGGGLTWELNNGELVISYDGEGTGVMNDYDIPNDNSAPWYANREDITSVSLPEGIKTIGKDAFRDCVNLTTVTIPNSVTTIGESAFVTVEHLETVTIGTGITSIVNGAFYGNDELTTVTCSATTPPSIGAMVFGSCTNLEHIYVPAESVDAYKTAWSDYASLISAAGGGSAAELSALNLNVGDVIHLGDKLTLSSGTVEIGGGYQLFADGSPYTLARADIDVNWNPIVSADGPYYVLLDNSGGQLLSRNYPVTANSDGIVITSVGSSPGIEKVYSIAVHEGGGSTATVVTITEADFPTGSESLTKDGVTVSAGWIDGTTYDIFGEGSFSTTLGNFTKIEVCAYDVSIAGEGWSGNSECKTWTGNASSVSFSGDIIGNSQGATLKFTIEDAAATPAYETVMNLINAIGTVELTAECKAKIDAARAAFIALSDGDKTQVTNYETLTTAEAAFENVMNIWLSGDCDAILWKDTTLTIRKHAGEGNGAMADYTSYYGDNTAPWYNSHWYNPQPGDIVIKSVTLEEGVTHIGENAFGWMSELKTITIPSSMTSIGEDAFYWSKAVDDIYLSADPSNLTWVLPYSADNQFKAEKATRCHVPADLLTAYQETFGTLNMTFVGDLDPITPLTPEQQQALDAAKGLITAIPSPVVYTPTCKDAIDAARAAYDALTPEMLKQLVSNYKTLTDAEATYANLKDVAEVEAKINEIPNPVTAADTKLSVYQKVQDVRAAYDALTAEQKALVEAATLKRLTDAEDAFAAIGGGGGLPTVVVIYKSEFTSTGVTKEGVNLALSNGSMTADDMLAMDGSFEFSTSLGKFTNITIETDVNIMNISEGAYTSAGWPTGTNLGTSAAWTGNSESVLIDCMVAGNAITITCTVAPASVIADAIAARDLINAIPDPVTLEDACVKAIKDAREAVTALGENASLIDASDVAKLTDAEAALTALNQAVADEVIAKINNIPQPVELKLATRDSINNARAAYDALNAAQQALVSNYQTLLDAEADLADLNKGGSASVDIVWDINTGIESVATNTTSPAYDGITITTGNGNRFYQTTQDPIMLRFFFTGGKGSYAFAQEDGTHFTKVALISSVAMGEWLREPSRIGTDWVVSDDYKKATWTGDADTVKIWDGAGATAWVDVDSIVFTISASSTPLDSAQAVKGLIESIRETLDATEACGAEIAAALDAYDALSDAAKGALDAADVQKLNDAATRYPALEAIAAIDMIPDEITYDPMTKSYIEIAKGKYDALSDASKALVPEDKVQKLTNSLEAWAILAAKIEHNVSYIGKDGELKNEKVALLHIPDPAPDFNGYEFVRWDVKAGDFLEEGLRIKAVYTPIITTNPAAYDTLVYNGTAQTLVTPGVAKEGHIEYRINDGEWSAELPQATFAAAYVVYYKLVREGHEDYMAGSVNVTIAKAPVTYTAPTAVETLVYNASNQTLIAAGQTNDGTFEYTLAPDVAESWSADLPQAKDAGTYSVYYRVQGDLNHLDSTAVDPIAVTIAKAELTATADNKAIIFGELAPQFTVTYAGWQGDDDASVLTGDIAYATPYVRGNNVGEYTITPSGVDAANYTITFVAGTLTVNRKSAESADITAAQLLDENLVYTNAVNKPTIVVMDTTLQLTEVKDYTLSFVGRGETQYAESATAPIHVGDYTAIVAFVGNYKDTLTVDFAIAKAPLTITADDKENIFGEEAPEFTVSYEGFLGNDTATVLTGTQEYACEYVRGNDVGDYTIIPSGVDAHDYAITFANGTLTVNRKSAKDADIVAAQLAGEKLIYTNAVNRPTIVVTDTTLQLTETKDYTLSFIGTANDASVYEESAVAPVKAGDYTAIVAFVGNYIDTLTVDFTVSKAPLTITADDKEMIYGDEHPEFTVSYNGFLGTDDNSVLLGTQGYSCSYAPGSYIGTYAITPKDVTAYDYAITFVDGTLTVNKAVVSISGAEAQCAKFADGNAQAVVLQQGTLNGIKLNDPIAHVTTAAYSSADVAEHLTVTLFYELTGDAALLTNYDLQPTSEVFSTEGVIIEPMIPDDQPAEKEDEETEVKEGIEVYAYGYCDGSGYSLRYHLETGIPDQYKIEFADSRFADIDWTDLEVTGPDGHIDILIPVDLPTGDYTMTVTFRDSRFVWLESKPFDVTFHVNLPETFVTPLFNNTIALVDTCNCFTDIQWYWRADETQLWQPIEGATGHYYRPEGGAKLTGEYFVQARMNGEPTYTCGQADMETLYGADKQQPKATVKAFPNPVVNTTTVTIENSENWNHSLRVVNLTGVEMFRTTFEGNETTVHMDGYVQGNYMISVDGIVVKVMKK